jgi:hypothetical protein
MSTLLEVATSRSFTKRPNLAHIFEDDKAANSVDGNLYRIAAAGATKLVWHEKITFLTVVIIQLIGPFTVLYVSIKGFDNPFFWPFGGGDASVGCAGNVGFVWQDNNKSGIEYYSKKALGVCFILGFHLNCYRYLKNEAATARSLFKVNLISVNTDFIVDWYDSVAERPNAISMSILTFGRFMNAWTTIGCVLALPYLFYNAEDPKDLVVDALSIAFLYSIDDVGGELGGIDESRWNALFIGTCAYLIEISKKRYETFHAEGAESEDELENLVAGQSSLEFAAPNNFRVRPVPYQVMQDLEEWAKGGEPTEEMLELELIYQPSFVGSFTAAELFRKMNANDKAWNIPDLAAIIVVFLAAWHSIMYTILGDPVCPAIPR